MTVSSVTPIGDIQTADGANRVWSFDFRIDDISELQLQVTNADGSVTSVSSGFTVTGIGSESGGTVTYPVSPTNPLATAVKVRPVRATPFGQPSRFGDQGAYSPEDVESAIDHVAKQILYVNETGTKRALVAPFDDGEIDMRLPLATDRAGKLLGFGSDGRPLAEYSPSSFTGILAQVQSVLEATLGVQGRIEAIGTGVDQDKIEIDALVNGAAAAIQQDVNDAQAVLAQIQLFNLGVKAADPTTDNTGGALQEGMRYWNSATDVERVYNGSIWQEVPTPSAMVRRERFVATANQTTFPIAGGYSPALVLVTYNGMVLSNGIDVDVSSGTNIVLTKPALAGAEVLFFGFGSFSVANALAPANNLSDLSNKSAAQQNLSLSSALISSGVTASQDFLVIPLTGGFRRYSLAVDMIEPVTNGSGLCAQISIDGGVTWISGAASYRQAGQLHKSDNTAPSAYGSAGAARLSISGAQIGGGGSSLLEITMPLVPSGSGWGPCRWRFAYRGNTGLWEEVVASGVQETSTLPATHLRLFYSAGNIAAGARWELIGQRN